MARRQFKRKRRTPNRRARENRRERRAARRVVVAKVVAVVLLLAVCAILPVFVNNVIGYVPLITVAFAIVGAFVYLQVLKRGLTFEVGSSARGCERNSDVDFVARFKSRVPLFYFSIVAWFYVNDLFGNTAARTRTTFALAPMQSETLHFGVTFDHIGTYSVGLEKVQIADFLRLFTHVEPTKGAYYVQVVPHVWPIANLEFSSDATIESARAAQAIQFDSLDYASVRDYVPGDPLKTIHWKLSARTDHYLTRLYELYTDPGVCIIMDFFAQSDEADELMAMFDCVVETALSVEAYARERGLETEMVYVDKDGVRVRDMFHQRSDLPDMMARLPRISNKRGEHDAIDLVSAESASIHGQNNIVVVSGNPSAELVSSVIEVRARRKTPLMFAVVPHSLIGREREDWAVNLRRLDAANIGYRILSDASELSEGGAIR